MRLVAILILLISAFGPFAFATDKTPPTAELVSRVRQLLPTKLSAVEPGKTTREQVRKDLGTPAKTKANADYFVLTGVRFDTTVGYAAGKVNQLIHRTRQPGLVLSDVEPWLTADHRKSLKDQLDPKKGPASESPRELSIQFPEAGLALTFDSRGRQPVRTIILGEAGK